MVSKQMGIIVTAVMAVLFGCAGIFSCVTTTLDARALFTGLGLRGAFGSGRFAALGASTCMSLGFIALPVVFYIILVANNKQEPPTAAPQAGPEAAPEAEAKDAPKE